MGGRGADWGRGVRVKSDPMYFAVERGLRRAWMSEGGQRGWMYDTVRLALPPEEVVTSMEFRPILEGK